MLKANHNDKKRHENDPPAHAKQPREESDDKAEERKSDDTARRYRHPMRLLRQRARNRESYARGTMPAELKLRSDVPLIYTVVGRKRSDQGVGGKLFHDVRRPTRDPCHHKQWRKHLRVEANEVIRRP